jgi:putative glycosyltransferase (TIGR04348 family)
MKIELITSSPPEIVDGCRVTAERWARILGGLGHQVEVRTGYSHDPCDMLIALHAGRSLDSIKDFRARHPQLPLVVALMGSDLYQDLGKRPEVVKGLEAATRLVVLHRRAVIELPESLRSKTWVIYQSADPPDVRVSPVEAYFQVVVAAHLDPHKDPFRAAQAARKLPLSSTIQVQHAGRAPDEKMEQKAKEEEKKNPRYRWLGELSHEKVVRLISSSRLVVIASQYEAGSNVLAEALVCSVPLLVTRTSGLVGTLGDDYPGYFPVGDTAELARLMLKAETDESFYEQLKERSARAAWLVRPERERASWQEFLRDLSVREASQRAFF